MSFADNTKTEERLKKKCYTFRIACNHTNEIAIHSKALLRAMRRMKYRLKSTGYRGTGASTSGMPCKSNERLNSFFTFQARKREIWSVYEMKSVYCCRSQWENERQLKMKTVIYTVTFEPFTSNTGKFTMMTKLLFFLY